MLVERQETFRTTSYDASITKRLWVFKRCTLEVQIAGELTLRESSFTQNSFPGESP